MAAEIEVARLIATLQVGAEGLEAGIEAAKKELAGLDVSNNEAAKIARRAMNDAGNAYRMAALEAQSLSNKVKYATSSEKAALQEAAAAAQKAADQKKQAFDAAALAYESVANKTREYAEVEKQAGQQSAVTSAAMAAGAAKAFSIIVGAVNTGIDAYNRYKASLQGLNAIASSKGFSQPEVAKGLGSIRDALVDTASASKALQNLLAKGFSLEGALETINAIKDSAAVNRAMHLSIAEAVVQTTEGIKNENSTLSDQAGITKNLSVMLKEYAEANGLVAASLTDAQRAEAYRLGVLQEAAPFAGAAVAQMDTLAGAQASVAASANELAVAYGESMAPTAQLLNEVLGELLGGLRGVVAEAPGLAAGATSSAAAIALLITAKKGWSLVTKVLATDLTALSTTLGISMPWIAALGAVVGVGVGLYTKYANEARKAVESERQAAEERRANIATMQGGIDDLQTLVSEYDALASKTGKTVSEKNRMLEIERRLSEQYGISIQGMDGQKLGYDALNEVIQANINLRKQELAATQATDAAGKLRASLEDQKQYANYYKTLKENIDAVKKAIEDGQSLTYDLGGVIVTKSGAELEAHLAGMEEHLRATLANGYGGAISAAMDYASAKVREKAPGISDAMLETVMGAFQVVAEANPEAVSTELVDKFVAGIDLGKISDMVEKFKLDLSAIGPLEGDSAALDQFNARMERFSADMEAYARSVAEALGMDEEATREFANALTAYAQNATGAFEEISDAAQGAGKEITDGLKTLADGPQQLVSSARAGIQAIDEQRAALKILQDERQRGTQAYLEAQKLINESYAGVPLKDVEIALNTQLELQIANVDAAKALAVERLAAIDAEIQAQAAYLQSENAAERARAEAAVLALQLEKLSLQGIAKLNWKDLFSTVAADEARRALAGLVSELQKQNKVVETGIANAKVFKQFEDAVKSATKSGKGLTQEALAIGRSLGFLGTTTAAAEQFIKDYKSTLSDAGGDVDILKGRIAALVNQMTQRGELDVDTSQAIAAMLAAATTAAELEEILKKAGVLLGETKGGGGGGKSRKEKEAEEAKRAAEEARRAQEEAWQKQLDAQLRMLERKKRLNEISTQEEIAQLERIMKKYAKTAEQRLAMEDRIFEARARLRDEEISQIDRLNDGIITALRNRYEEQQRLEDERLDASVEAWRDWADENVKAIQAQIDALDELAKQEDRSEQEAAKLRKIEATRQMLAYTTDEANRERLQKELQQLEEDYAKWQRQNAIADEKERLRAEQEAIRERAEAEQDALADQKEALQKYYEDLLKEASLRAEAERMLVGANQEEILDLIGSYAPDYEATGKSLGERLYKGLVDAMGNITDWVSAFTKQLQAIQAEIAETALAAADAHAASQTQTATVSTPSATTVYNTNNFNVPVESPADTARKVQQANEDLGAQLGYT